MDLEADLEGIAGLLRSHVEIRNRSWMKIVHPTCFIGSEAVDFLVMQGLVDTRDEAVQMCNKMLSKKLIRHVSDGQAFRDAYSYYIFAEDESDGTRLASTQAGNGDGTHFGKGGCKWSFAAHTAHNSYVLDISLADEIERAIAGASVEARALAISKLRQRVREQAAHDAPDWKLDQSTEVNGVLINVYNRPRPRGDFKNVKMTGKIGESPKDCIRGIMTFTRRRQWERMFQDGIVVEAIDIGEPMPSPLFDEVAEEKEAVGGAEGAAGGDMDDLLSGIPEAPAPTGVPPRFLNLPESAHPQTTQVFARKTDDVFTFLQTVDLAGIPRDMAIAFLNDPERQHALGHLRKQMLASSPQECMLCTEPFESAAQYRFCPCCASICCASCVSKRVFEVVSRQVVTVCLHCYRESSRIRQPPEVVKDASHIGADVRGKWWRPEDLGIPDYSDGLANSTVTAPTDNISQEVDNGDTHAYDNDPDHIALEGVSPLLPGIHEPDVPLSKSVSPPPTRGSAPTKPDVNDIHTVDTADVMFALDGGDTGGAATVDGASAGESVDPAAGKMARCKRCGEQISRDVECIERHMDECVGLRGNEETLRQASIAAAGESGEVMPSKILGGIARRPELEKAGTRIVYHTARSSSKLFRPREVCALQDSFCDKNGAWYAYEISVRHCDVRGTAGHTTAEVLLLLHAATPIRGVAGTCEISIISQVDSRSRAPKWLLSLTEEGGGVIAAPRRMDLVRELKASGNLVDILATKSPDMDGADNDAKVSLNDFELLAVLGRGGFGKVMQVRHKQSRLIYAMKILKKSELQRRRQVERTKTERTILAAIQHPFIVCLHYAFQNSQKLYMVMDFVQGGDFFTLMRKYRRLPEDWVRVYVSEVAMALQHLHDMDIVYRDLKPENILLCADGHLKLTDFGLSRFFETRPPAPEDMVGGEDAVTRSFCGTEQYMSPEMLLQQGHNWRMDWWCLGLLMHEMISARHPFHGPSHYDTLRNMVTKQPVIDARVSSQAATVIRGLLIKNPRARLCCKTGMEELKALPFFSTTDWVATYNREIPVPHVPSLADMTDTSSFEATFTREAAVDSVAENPRAKKRKGGGIMGMFGFNMQGSASTKKEDSLGEQPFAGFSFAKDDTEGLGENA